MKLSDIYNTILAQVNQITGQTYVIDRAPQQNFSDGFSGTYRFVRPSGVSKERRSQGVPETVISVEVGLLSLDSSPTNIAAAEDELDTLLNNLLRRAQIGDNLLIYASNTSPTDQQYLSVDGMDAEVPVVEAVATVSIRGYY